MRSNSRLPVAVVCLFAGPVVALTACGSDDDTNTPTLSPPQGLTYSAVHAVYAVNEAIAPNTPSVGGGAVASYGVSPTLPAGLTLAVVTGVISGTPTTLQAPADYVVTATNAAGSTTTTLSIEIKAAAVPAGLDYGVTAASYGTPGTDITPLDPTSAGGPISSYTISPSLPAGLALDPTSGRISGRPTAVSAATDYEIVGSNSLGSTSFTLSIDVFDAATVAAPHEVSIAGMAFQPASLSIERGATVKWTNSDAANHNATSTSMPQAWTQVVAYGSGGTQLVTFNNSGSFPYKCSVHPSMTASVMVAP